jgi:uncharacterized protein YkwD
MARTKAKRKTSRTIKIIGVSLLALVVLLLAISVRNVIQHPLAATITLHPNGDVSAQVHADPQKPVIQVPVTKPATAMTTTAATTSPAVVLVAPYPDARQEIFDEVNAFRIANGVPPLKRNFVLDASAQAKADALTKLNFFAHNDPDGREPWHYFDDAGYRWTQAGENLSKDFAPEDAVKAWIASPLHKKNLLNPQYEEVGLAIEGPYIVQHFGKQKLTH